MLLDSGWYNNAGEQGDTVISSRVRLARNISSVPFPVRLNVNRKNELNERICAAVYKCRLPLKAIDMSRLYAYEAVSLAERHLITPEFASFSEGRVLLLSQDEKISIMLNENDHIRIQVIEEGLSPEKAAEKAFEIDGMLDGELQFAFDSRFGFLNQSPRDIGTGMRVSVMMHLPALSKTGDMSKFASTAAKLGLTVRGAYGDSTDPKGDIYRLSNNVVMGISESQAVSNLKSIALQLATKERRTAEEFIKDISVKDRINRSMGLLSNAMLLSTDEMMEALSWVRLGAVYSLVDIKPQTVNSLFVTMQPATLNVLAGTKLSQVQRDEIRAKIVREKLYIK